MYVTMKRTLALCAAACSTGVWFSPAEAAAVGFLRRGSGRSQRDSSDEVLFANGVLRTRADQAPAADMNALFDAPGMANIMTTVNPYVQAAMSQMGALTTAMPGMPVQYGGVPGAMTTGMPGMPVVGAMTTGMPGMPVMGGMTPSPYGLGFTTGPPTGNLSVLPEFEVFPTPLPPCNWTHDFEGVARPADCEMMTDGNYTCVRGENTTFILDPEKIEAGNVTCMPPKVQSCNVSRDMFPLDYSTPLYEIEGLDGDCMEHGHEFYVTCSENATAVDHRYPLESWGQDWYPGIKKSTVVCNNGTLIRLDKVNGTDQQYWPAHYKYQPAIPDHIAPKGLNCVLKEKVDLTQDLVSYLRWTEPRMTEAETRGYKWIDVDAIFHKTMLKDAMVNSSRIENDARNYGELKPVRELKHFINRLIDYRMVPRGEEYTQDTCKDLEKHWLYQIKNTDPFKKANNIGYANYAPPVNKSIGFPTHEDLGLETPIKFSCSYTRQKSPAGFDPYTGVLNYHYRDGCYCESRWMNGCPFRAELSPNYKTFGFDALEIKSVSTALGAPTNALCWYFSKPANPEWGYLKTAEGFSFQAPAQNVTELKRDWIKLRREAQDARFKKHYK